MHLALLHGQQHPAYILLAHAGAGVFEATGYAHIGAAGVIHILQGVQAGGHIGVGVGGLAVGEHVAGLYHVPAPELPGVYAHHLRQKVDVHLCGKAALGDAEATEGAGDHIIGVYGHTEDVHILVVVGSGGMGAGPVEHRPAQGGVGPGIGNDDALHAGELAVFVAGGGELHLHGVALHVVVQGLLAGVLHLNRLFQLPGCQSGVLLYGHILLAAEAAAHQGSPAVDLLLGYLENLGALPLHIVDGLAGGVYQQPVLTLGHGYAALRLHESVLLPGGLVLAGDHILGVLYGLVGIATHQVCPAHDVAVGVDERGVSLESVKGVGDGSEFGVVYLHQGAELIQLVFVGGDYHGQNVAHIAGDVALAHDDVPVLLDVAGLVAGHVLPQ